MNKIPATVQINLNLIVESPQQIADIIETVRGVAGVTVNGGYIGAQLQPEK